MAKDIKIYKGYADGSLDLSDDGYTEVCKGRSIKWTIEDRSGPGSIKVASIVSIEIKPISNGDIFSERPAKEDNTWKAKVKDENVVKGKKCEYAIHWKDEQGTPYICDPIIAVKPSGMIEPPPVWLIGVAVGVAAILSLVLLRKKKKRSKNKQKSK